jgi:hypothetical protein
MKKLRLFIIILALIAFIFPVMPVYADTLRINSSWENQKLRETLHFTFALDGDAVGEWEIVDFTQRINGYDPSHFTYDMTQAQYRGNSFYDYGRVTQHYSPGFKVHSLWTKGFIINDWNQTVPEYEIKRINGKYYMFIALKDNNYIQTGIPQGYYVFRKISNEPQDNNADLYREVKNEYENGSIIPADLRKLPVDLNIPFRIMWLIYADGMLDGKRFQMSDSQKQMVFDVMDNFKAGVEKAANHNVKIFNDYTIIQRQIDISDTKPEVGGSYISPEMAKPDIDKYAPSDDYHFVFAISFINTAPVRGVSVGSLWVEQGYANCNFYQTGDALNTSIAVHEFLHAFETERSPGSLPGINIPPRHAIIVGTEGINEFYPGYEIYAYEGEFHEEAVEYDYRHHMLAFDKAIFQANVQYTDPVTEEVRYVGIFPSMWKFFKR